MSARLACKKWSKLNNYYLINDTEKLLQEVEAQLPAARGPPHLDPYPGGGGEELHHPLQGAAEHPAAPRPLEQTHLGIKPKQREYYGESPIK